MNRPPRYVRGTSDYDLYRNPMSWEARKREEKISMGLGCLFVISFLAFLSWLGNLQ